MDGQNEAKVIGRPEVVNQAVPAEPQGGIKISVELSDKAKEMLRKYPLVAKVISFGNLLSLRVQQNDPKLVITQRESAERIAWQITRAGGE